MLVKLLEIKPASAISVLQDFIDKLPSFFSSMRYDQRWEMLLYKQLSQSTGHAYFCDSHSARQRDSNESMNGLMRQYMSK